MPFPFIRIKMFLRYIIMTHAIRTIVPIVKIINYGKKCYKFTLLFRWYVAYFFRLLGNDTDFCHEVLQIKFIIIINIPSWQNSDQNRKYASEKKDASVTQSYLINQSMVIVLDFFFCVAYCVYIFIHFCLHLVSFILSIYGLGKKWRTSK